MADNTTLPGTGEIYASEEIENSAGDDINYQIIKLAASEKGDAPVQVSKAAPLPVSSVRIETLLAEISLKLSILIRHNEHLTDEIFTEEDLD